MIELVTPQVLKDSTDYLTNLAVQSIPNGRTKPLPSTWAEEKRVLPAGLTPYPGPFSFDVCPPLREVLDCLSADSPLREVVLMKGTQLASTTAVGENWIGYVIDQDPAPMLYISGTAGMAEKAMETKIDALINSAGLQSKIRAQHKRLKQRKTGDIKVRKEFDGGFLMAAGPKSGAVLRSFSFKYLFPDEVETYPDDVQKEGDPIALIRNRTDAFKETYKIFWTSTPKFKHNSKIEPLYEQGDQSKCFVPCKHCGHLQFLKWGNLKWDEDKDGFLVCTMDSNHNLVTSSVRYECEKCGGHWVNADKDFFLPRYEWRPTARPTRFGMRSFHYPGLYSPVGFRSWDQAVMEFLDLKRRGFPKLEFQNFINTFLAETYIDEGKRPKIEAVMTREKTYTRNTLPKDADPIFCTIGADVQADRIECEIVAWGRDAQSWSIDYRVFKGDTEKDTEPWEELRRTILQEHVGLGRAKLSGIDSGHRTSQVYKFCDSFADGVHAIKGGDKLGSSYLRAFRVTGADTARIDLNTDLLKQDVYEYLNKSVYEDGRVPMGYCNFPEDYDRSHYQRLTAETRMLIGKKMQWVDGGRRNEQLDCRVYALGMVYAFKEFVQEYAGGVEFSWPEFWNYIYDLRRSEYAQN